jgi:hypothetical protein
VGFESQCVYLQHWHGLFQKITNYADGPSFVTQCPIIPQEGFLYDFSVPDQAVLPLTHFSRFRHAHHIAHFRGHSGITVTSGTNIVMACVELWLSMIQMILTSICMMLIMVRQTLGVSINFADIFHQMKRLSPLRIGITIFRRMLPQSRKFNEVCQTY